MKLANFRLVWSQNSLIALAWKAKLCKQADTSSTPETISGLELLIIMNIRRRRRGRRCGLSLGTNHNGYKPSRRLCLAGRRGCQIPTKDELELINKPSDQSYGSPRQNRTRRNETKQVASGNRHLITHQVAGVWS